MIHRRAGLQAGVAAAMLLCGLCGGCVFPTVGAARVRVTALKAPGYANSHGPADGEQLPAEVVVVRFYTANGSDTGRWYDSLGADVLGRQGEVVSYPLHTYLVVFLGQIGTRWPYQGMIAFKEDCWPTLAWSGREVPRNFSGYLSYMTCRKGNDSLKFMADEDATIVHIPRSQGVPADVSMMAGGAVPRGFPAGDKRRADFFDDVITTVQWSWSLNDRQRLMVYKSLLDLFEVVAKHGQPGEDVYQPHRERLRKLIGKLQPQ